MSQVLQTNCDYKIKTQEGGTITLDVGTPSGNGQVIITADLIVQGDQTTINTTDLDIEDNIIRLNKGESGDGVTLRYSGIEIDRGFSSPGTPNFLATLRFDENADAFEIVFRDDQSGTVTYNSSALKTRKIITDNLTDSGDLTLIGSGTGVVKVDGTTDYELYVTQDDDIPNKRYVDVSILNRDPANRIERDDTYVIVRDIDGGARANAQMRLFRVNLNNPGLSYQPGDLLSINEGIRFQETVIRVDTVDVAGAIQTYTVLDRGLFSQLPPSQLNITTFTNSLNGSNATFDINYALGNIELVNPGNDYESVTVNIIDNGGEVSPATATAAIDLDPFSITYRQITSVTVVDEGEYNDIPSITFSAGINPSLTESVAQVVVENSIIAQFFSNRAEIGGLEILGNTISNNDTNENIVLRTQGTAAVEVPRAIQFNATGEVIPAIPGSSIIYGDPESNNSNPQTPGGTGLYYNSTKQQLVWNQWVTNNQDANINSANLVLHPAKNELISKQKALVFSMLF